MVSSDVVSVRLVSSSGAVLDTMAPSSGVAVLAATGETALAGTSVVGLDAAGATVATVSTAQDAPTASPVCITVSPMPIGSVPTTTPVATTGPVTTVPTSVPGGQPSVATTPRSS